MSGLSKDEIKWVYEQSALRSDSANKRMFVIIIILVVGLFLSNAFWIWKDSQYIDEVVTTTIQAEQEAEDGSNYIIGGDYDGKTEDESYEND